MSQTAYSTGMHYMEDFVTISTVLKANSQRPNFTVVVVAFFFKIPRSTTILERLSKCNYFLFNFLFQNICRFS